MWSRPPAADMTHFFRALPVLCIHFCAHVSASVMRIEYPEIPQSPKENNPRRAKEKPENKNGPLDFIIFCFEEKHKNHQQIIRVSLCCSIARGAKIKLIQTNDFPVATAN